MFQKFYLHSRHFNQFELWFYSKAKFSFCVLKWIIGSESAEIVALAVYKLSSLLWHTLSRSRRKCMTVHDFFRVHGMKSTSWNRPHRVSSSQYYEVHRTHCPTERRERKKFMKIELIFNSQQGVLSMIGAFSYSECKLPALAREKNSRPQRSCSQKNCSQWTAFYIPLYITASVSYAIMKASDCVRVCLPCSNRKEKWIVFIGYFSSVRSLEFLGSSQSGMVSLLK